MTLTFDSIIRCAGGNHLTVHLSIDGGKPVEMKFSQQEIDEQKIDAVDNPIETQPWFRQVVLHEMRGVKIADNPKDAQAFDAAVLAKAIEV